MAKPSVVRRHLGKLLKRLVQSRFSVVGCWLKTLSVAEAEAIVPSNKVKVSYTTLLLLKRLTQGSVLLAVG